MSDTEKIEALKANLNNLNERNRKFADSLLSYWEKKGFLSDKQWYWVGKLGLTSESKNNKKRKEAPKNKPDRFEELLAAFRNANPGQCKRLKRAVHPDLWGGSPLMAELFKAVNS